MCGRICMYSIFLKQYIHISIMMIVAFRSMSRGSLIAGIRLISRRVFWFIQNNFLHSLISRPDYLCPMGCAIIIYLALNCLIVNTLPFKCRRRSKTRKPHVFTHHVNILILCL